jgi:hypothetical protein
VQHLGPVENQKYKDDIPDQHVQVQNKTETKPEKTFRLTERASMGTAIYRKHSLSDGFQKFGDCKL